MINGVGGSSQVLAVSNMHLAGAVLHEVLPSYERLDVRSEYFLGDFLSLHGAQIGRDSDVKEMMTYHSDNSDWSITPACKEQLMSALMDLVPEGGSQVHNRVFLDAIRDWYQGLDSASKVDNYTAAKDHLSDKGKNIARMILQANHNLGSGSNEIRLLDVGGNDGKLTSYVASHIGDYLHVPISPYVLEIETGIAWDHNSKVVSLVQSEMSRPVKTIYYDGSDMASGRVSGQDEGNPLSDGKGFDCAMYQHSLHHFPSPEIQQESLARISELLNDGGVLTITEHNSVLGGHELDLMHMVLQVYVELHQNPDISSSELEAVFNEFVEKETPANFFSQTRLVDMAQKVGLTPSSVTAVGEKADRTYSMTFVKDGGLRLDRDRSFEALVDPDSLKAGMKKFETSSMFSGSRSLDGMF